MNPVMERFFRKIKFYNVGDPRICWLWTDKLEKTGYGQFALPNHRKVSSHRASFEFFIGPVTNGMIIHHKCERKDCVNPNHLELLTQGEHNSMHSTKDVCIRGHSLTSDNLYYDRNGSRHCRECKLLTGKNRRERLSHGR